jgi:2-oxoglutarate ferredoxin oxidoreductase subunit alpha
MKGNEAFAKAAICAGCRYYFGYPITPQSELTEYMSHALFEVGGEFVQAESELAAISMIYGAGLSGGRVLGSSSSPGIALMQEGISFACSTEVPFVMINVSRGGPGVGTIQPGQADYYQATRGGGNGDYHVIVYAPASIQEGVQMVYDAFDTADKFRNPVMILADGMLGQMMEPVELPPMKEPLKEEDIPKVKPWALCGKGVRGHKNVIKSLELKPEALEERINAYWPKFDQMRKELTSYEAYNLEGAEVVFVAYGSTSRIVREAIDLLAKDGIKAGLIRPISLWPYPYDAFDKIGKECKAVISCELSMGQMIDDVKLGAKDRWPVSLIGKVGGMLLTPVEIAEGAKKQLGVK